MSDQCILAVSLKLPDGIYKLASVFRAKDKSFYIAFPVGGIAQSIDNDIKNIKFSYHTTGKTHMKMKGGEHDTIVEFDCKPKFDEIKGIISTDFNLSFWDINTINSNKLILDKTANKHRYDKHFEIDASNYEHLSIKFFVGEKGCFEKTKPKNKYKEVLVINLEDIDLIMTTKDEWAGEHQEKKPPIVKHQS